MMDSSAPDVGAIVLAAGAGARFGGAKLEERLDGKPVLQHVLDALDSGSAFLVTPDDALAALRVALAAIESLRTGRPVDVAPAALYFASDESSYCTGTELVVDGGLHAGMYVDVPGMFSTRTSE